MVPYLAVSFTVYDHLKAQVKEDRSTRQLWWYPLAKVGMGATASTVAQVPAHRMTPSYHQVAPLHKGDQMPSALDFYFSP